MRAQGNPAHEAGGEAGDLGADCVRNQILASAPHPSKRESGPFCERAVPHRRPARRAVSRAPVRPGAEGGDSGELPSPAPLFPFARDPRRLRHDSATAPMTDRTTAALIDTRLLNADAAGMILERLRGAHAPMHVAHWYGDDRYGVGGIGRAAFKQASACSAGLAILAFATARPPAKRSTISDEQRLRLFFSLGLDRGLRAIDMAEEAGESTTILAQASEAGLGYLRALSPDRVERWDIRARRWVPASPDCAKDFFFGGARRLSLAEREDLGIPPDESPSQDSFTPR